METKQQNDRFVRSDCLELVCVCDLRCCEPMIPFFKKQYLDSKVFMKTLYERHDWPVVHVFHWTVGYQVPGTITRSCFDPRGFLSRATITEQQQETNFQTTTCGRG